jgi:hypothetical protein
MQWSHASIVCEVACGPSLDEHLEKRLSMGMVEITTLYCVLFIPRVCPLRQPPMSPTNVTASTDEMKKFRVLHGGWLQTSHVEKHYCLFC